MLPLLLAFACAPKPVAAEAPARAAAPPVESGKLPTPYTATQIHDAFPAGAELRFQVTEAGGPAVIERMTFSEPTPETVVVHSEILAADGTVLKDEGRRTHRWDELRDHASFPVAGTRRSEGSVTVPAGSFTTLHYDVPDVGEGGVPVLIRYDFDVARPGPPVKMVVESDGQVLMTMELLSRSP